MGNGYLELGDKNGGPNRDTLSHISYLVVLKSPWGQLTSGLFVYEKKIKKSLKFLPINLTEMESKFVSITVF